ncbi:MAG: alpha/beta hydrolase [Candidatus Brocadiia bacterium]
MRDRMRAYLLKGLMRAGDVLGRWFFFHDPAPPVGRLHPDLPYGPHPRQKLDVFEPEQAGPHAVVVYLHGGGWVAGDKSSYTWICRQLARRGYVVVNANYRLAPRHTHPAQLRDTASVVRWTRGRAERFGGDADRIVLAGDSAGAQLTSWYAAALARPALLHEAGLERAVPLAAIRCLVLFYGAFDLQGMFDAPQPAVRILLHSLLGEDREQFRRNARTASPIRHLSRQMPPCFLCASDLDPLQPQTLEMACRLGELGCQVKLCLVSGEDYPDARHGFLNFYRRRCAQVAVGEALDFAQSVCPP